MRHLLLSPLLFLGLITSTLHAQQWQWARPGGGTENAYGLAVAVDVQGNSVVTGTYTGTIGFGGQQLSSPGEEGIFVAKFDPDGVLLWLHIAANGPGITVHGITTDDAENIAIVGMYQGAVTFIPGPLGTTLNSAGSVDVFVVEYNTDGSPLWARSIGDVGYDYGASIAHDGNGNVYVTGDLHQTAFNLSGSKVFVAKFDPDGMPVWTTTSAEYGVEHLGDGICTNDAGEVCITGEFFDVLTLGTITLDSGTPEATIYVAKLNSDGVPLWMQKAGAGGYAFGQSVGMDAQGNAYVTGSYHGTMAMGALTLAGPSDTSLDVFVAKCASADGEFQWATRGEGPGGDRAVGICVDAAGNSYINGSYAVSWTLGTTTLETNGGVDGYVAKLSPDGDAVWAKDYGGPTGESIGGMALHGNDVFLTGAFQVSMLFDPGPTLTGQPVVRDVFVAKLTDVSTGVEDTEQPHLSLFPDPATDRLQVQGIAGTFGYAVVDMHGKAVITGRSASERSIDVSPLSKGHYVLCLAPMNGAPAQRLKFVKE